MIQIFVIGVLTTFFSTPTTKYFVSNMAENEWNAHLKLKNEKENLILLERTRRPEIFLIPAWTIARKYFSTIKKFVPLELVEWA